MPFPRVLRADLNRNATLVISTVSTATVPSFSSSSVPAAAASSSPFRALSPPSTCPSVPYNFLPPKRFGADAVLASTLRQYQLEEEFESERAALEVEVEIIIRRVIQEKCMVRQSEAKQGRGCLTTFHHVLAILRFISPPFQYWTRARFLASEEWKQSELLLEKHVKQEFMKKWHDRISAIQNSLTAQQVRLNKQQKSKLRAKM